MKMIQTLLIGLVIFSSGMHANEGNAGMPPQRSFWEKVRELMPKMHSKNHTAEKSLPKIALPHGILLSKMENINVGTPKSFGEKIRELMSTLRSRNHTAEKSLPNITPHGVLFSQVGNGNAGHTPQHYAPAQSIKRPFSSKPFLVSPLPKQRMQPLNTKQMFFNPNYVYSKNDKSTFIRNRRRFL